MIELNVQLFGTLQSQFPLYDPTKGLLFRMKKRIKIYDLKKKLNLTEAISCAVVVDGRVMKSGEIIKDRAFVKIFQVTYGG